MPKAVVLFAASCALLAACGPLAGCRSPWVQAIIDNQQSTPVNVLEVDYPGGSFGVQSIAPHATFRYRFHLLGTDKVVLTFTDAAEQNRKSTGPELEKGQAGTLRIEIEPGDRVEWIPTLAAAR
ncbi:MAG TPA: hypothetical protein VMD25_04360 [Acidobacteriaceae bacterium]|nr:hypothetical protein [Acidobacteriaceae bacterium]